MEARKPDLTSPSNEKLRTLQDSVSDQLLKVNGSGQSISLATLAASLFDRAPEAFLQERSVAELGERARWIGNSFREYLLGHNERPVRVEERLEEKSTLLCVSLRDRPFIVNTIGEALRDLTLKPIAYTHPLIDYDGQRYSISFIELPALSPEKASLVIKRIESSLNELVAVTDAYPVMLAELSALESALSTSPQEATTEDYRTDELILFLNWLREGAFVFIGSASWSLSGEKDLISPPASTSGLCGTSSKLSSQVRKECWDDAVRLLNSKKRFSATKLESESVVHRKVRLTHLAFHVPASHQAGRQILSFVGMLTSKAYSQESSSIPLIRAKLKYIIESERALVDSHNYKNITNIFDSIPKDDLLRLDKQSLYEDVKTVLAIQRDNETRISIRFDSSKRGYSVLIIMPRDHFNSGVRDQLQQHLESAFGAKANSSEYNLALSNKPFARLHFYIPVKDSAHPPVDLPTLQQEIADLSRTWQDNMTALIESAADLEDRETLASVYGSAFPEDYCATYSVEEALTDVRHIEQLSGAEPLGLRIAVAKENPEAKFSLFIYTLEYELTLSQTLPVLENAGLYVINERSSLVNRLHREPAYIHHFLVSTKSGATLTPDRFRDCFAPGLSGVLLGKKVDDRLNSLLITAGLQVQAIALLRAYAALLWQVTNFASRAAILDALCSEPAITALLWKMFESRFRPHADVSLAQRAETFAEQKTKYLELLRSVSDINKDRILRSLLSLLEHTIRTNFFCHREAIALKLESELIDILPRPRPKFEVFVHSKDIEGVHMRTGPVARGGIRWSDRPEDYRNEILGLTKTQKIKNVIIVPEGAKGGFVLKSVRPNEDLHVQVAEGYKTFIRSLLSITDNRAGEQILPPEHVVAFDAPDPYLVVAADKGTATFSDLANKIATEEFQFWLGDAFASGGSNGYDHKVYGITARGAWESVKRHFSDSGINMETDTFTATGIGDMSGDVFGNGLLLSDKYKLIAAFNHKHIFLDPNPDPAVSFHERKRMFELPRSSWSDYRTEAMSAGGGVFGRFDKEIVLSPEARSSLGVSDEVPSVINGESLISLILKAPVDLLWNGGIGTYVKSRSETNAEVNDPTNDAVRINSDELRAKVIGEGGNLGFTQKARIDYSLRGGRINTDAIDNSGGVDTSDHEVNLKILLAPVVQSGRLSLEERNQLLLTLAPEVMQDVLKNNYAHALLLTRAEDRAKRGTLHYKSLIRALEKGGFVNRHLDSLPSDELLDERELKKAGLTRPELAVCLAGVKMWLKKEILGSKLINDPLLKESLVNYFPTAIREKYRQEILDHPLAANIIATQITNKIVEFTGITFVHRMSSSQSLSPITVIKCILAADHIIQAADSLVHLRSFDSFTNNHGFLGAVNLLSLSIRDLTSWFVSCEEHGKSLPLAQLVENFRAPLRELIISAEAGTNVPELGGLQTRMKNYIQLNIAEDTARVLAAAPVTLPLMEAIWISQHSEARPSVALELVSSVSQFLKIDQILSLEHTVQARDKWEYDLLANALHEIRKNTSLICVQLIQAGDRSAEAIRERLSTNPSFEHLSNSIEENLLHQPSVAGLSVLAKQLKAVVP